VRGTLVLGAALLLPLPIAARTAAPEAVSDESPFGI
jgi:hypothetical protein